MEGNANTVLQYIYDFEINYAFAPSTLMHLNICISHYRQEIKGTTHYIVRFRYQVDSFFLHFESCGISAKQATLYLLSPSTEGYGLQLGVEGTGQLYKHWEKTA